MPPGNRSRRTGKPHGVAGPGTTPGKDPWVQGEAGEANPRSSGGSGRLPPTTRPTGPGHDVQAGGLRSEAEAGERLAGSLRRPHQACPARGSLSLSVPTARALLAPPWPRTCVLYPSPAGYFQESLFSPCQASVVLPWPGPSPRLEGEGLLPRGLWNSPHPRSPSWPSQAFLV